MHQHSIVQTIRYLALCTALLCSAHIHASDASPARLLTQRALAADLHQSKVWRQLLHYQSSSRSPSGIESQVDDPRYFLATDGKFNPQAELLATIDALFIKADLTVTDKHPSCRFVSREAWLRDQLKLPSVAVPDACALYHDWRGVVGSHSMSLVFPASYLNSPSSMFGHTLLRLDPENIDDSSEWLSWSLNFAADTGSENFSAGYAFKGIAGGYAGKFNSIPYFKKLQEYGAIENRDIWEYKLDFTTAELDRMLDHVWELRDISFDYYFFRQNCSYRLLELMDYARPSLNLTNEFQLTTIPADTIKAVAAADIITDTHYRPSLGTGIQARYQSIPRQLKHWVEDIANSDKSASEPEFQQLDIALQANIVRVANDLITYRSRRTSRSAQMAKRRLSLLKLMSTLPNTESTVYVPDSPETGHDTRTVSLGLGRSSKREYSGFGIRWSYHDLLDRNKGYLKGAGIVLGDLQLRRYKDGQTQLQSLELVKLQSISDRALIFNTLSWDLSVGLARDRFRLNNRLSAKVSGSIGKSTELRSNTIGYALIAASVVQFNRIEESFVDAALRLGTIHYYRGAATQVELTIEAAQDEPARLSGLLNFNLPLARNHALRFSINRTRVRNNIAAAATAQYRYYF